MHACSRGGLERWAWSEWVQTLLFGVTITLPLHLQEKKAHEADIWGLRKTEDARSRPSTPRVICCRPGHLLQAAWSLQITAH